MSGVALPLGAAYDDRVKARFLSLVEHVGECWIWRGNKAGDGYGRIYHKGLRNGQAMKVHRYAYHAFVGPLTESHAICHSCDVKLCVNPAHLRSDTQAENNRDIFRRGRSWQQKRTHCRNGHPYDAVNTDTRDGRRYCRQCGRTSTMARRRSTDPPHRKGMKLVIHRDSGEVFQVFVPRAKRDAETHRRIGVPGQHRTSRGSITLEELRLYYDSAVV